MAGRESYPRGVKKSAWRRVRETNWRQGPACGRISDFADSRLPTPDARFLRCFAGGNAMDGGLLHVVGFDLNRALQVGLYYVLDAREVFPVMAFGILPRFPEADGH